MGTPEIPTLPVLRPGDHLLYNIRSPWRDPVGWFVDWLIRFKTWSEVAHIEVYAGRQHAMASRSNGVDLFPFRAEGLRFVLRPRATMVSFGMERRAWDETTANKWFGMIARGQKYDWLGLFCFTLAVRQGRPHHMFCSEFARNLDRAAGLRSFAENWPGDKTAPGSFLLSPAFDLIYDSDLDYAANDQTDWRKPTSNSRPSTDLPGCD